MLKFILLFWLTANPVPHFTDNAELTAYYDRVNRVHFGGKLKPACVHFVKGLLDDGNEARVYEGLIPPCYYVIEIDEILVPLTKDSKMDVLHELCHVATKKTAFGGHGPKWKACMLRLAREGAMDDIW